MTYPLYIVDVFAEQPYSGNPLAVVMDADDLSAEKMQLVAAELDYSETTFVMSKPGLEAGYPVRIFTPAREIAFAGHPILGTAWVLRHHLRLETSQAVQVNLAVGQVPVTFEAAADAGETVWFRAPPAQLGVTCAAERMAFALGLSPDDIEPRAPVQQCSAGTSAMIVPVRNLDALRRCRVDLEAYAPLAAEGCPHLVYVFCSETRHPGNDLSARFFFEAHGVREDPASGNAAAFLGVYLLQHRLFDRSELLLRIEQGYEVRRPSLVMLRARMASSPEVWVGGKVILTVEGTLVSASCS